MKTVCWLAAVTLSASLLSCREGSSDPQSGKTTSVEKVLSDTARGISIEAPLAADIFVKPGNKTEVKLTGDERLLSALHVSSADGVLKIQMKSGTWRLGNTNLKASIIIASLQQLDLISAANASVKGTVAGNALKIAVKGAGEADFEQIDVEDLAIDIAGTGDIDIAGGKAARAKYKVSGAGDVDAYGLQARDVAILLSGTGDVKVTALSVLQANVSGAGSVHYKGNPVVRSKVSGVGDISQVKE